MYFIYKEKKIVAEIKCRDIKYLDYNEHIIEETKLEALKEAKERENCDVAYYVNFFGENNLIIYTLNKIIQATRVDSLYCNNTTVEPSYKRDKRIIYIHKYLGCSYKKITGKWYYSI